MADLALQKGRRSTPPFRRVCSIAMNVSRSSSSFFRGLATVRKLKSSLRKVDIACGEDLIFEPIDDGSLTHLFNGSSFAVLPGTSHIRRFPLPDRP
ncbi:hypothetical protein HYPDE_23483 [Hyphomicrobium denitrificans 1NES1]|uniref:Uncharacterized protein n=1 Tax=Hyphomicrobium denitrificans 1NES1 TaxID=670307 RepID=N0B0F6_9HYPH|nr:hypothetical protein HYPDE_23483 [Hyphomicrobium denitrificans 1NES1]